MQDSQNSSDSLGPELARRVCGKILSGAAFQGASTLGRLLDTCAAAYAAGERPALDDEDRAELKRLRRRLDDYYAAEGARDPVRVEAATSDGALRFASSSQLSEIEAWAATPETAGAGGTQPNRRLYVILLAVIAAGALFWLYQHNRLASPGTVATMAVLPFDDTRPLPMHDGAAPGITAALSVELAHVREWRTVSYTSVLPFAYNLREMAALRRELNADIVMEGKLTPSETTIDGELWMVRTSDGKRVWRHSFHTSREQLLPALDRAAQEAAARLGGTLPARALLSPRSGKPGAEAVAGFLSAISIHQPDPPEMQTALRALEAAVKSEPRFTAAHAALADLWGRISYFEYRPVAEATATARRVAREALAVEPDLPEAHLALGVAAALGDWNWTEARQQYNRALELRPSYPFALLRLAQLELVKGDTKAAVALAERALALDPAPIPVKMECAYAYIYDGQYEKALALMNEAEQINPEERGIRLVRGMAYLARKEYERAKVFLDVLTKQLAWLPPSAAIAGPVYAWSGDTAEVRRLLTEIHNKKNFARVDPVVEAGIRLAIGEDRAGYQLLEDAVRSRATLALTLRVNPIFAPYRQDPRFQAIVAKLGAPESSPARELRK
ncbi:MAG: tetratricopeptide repeat protein [Bryobacterales bacterium]|nr:tetratricopeptide repeat protein [Bryobacterales bacterium]